MTMARALDTFQLYGLRTLMDRILLNRRLLTIEQIVNREQRKKRVPILDGVSIPIDSSSIAPVVKAWIIIGIYEEAERKLIRQFLPNNEPVIELGASIGVISCVTNKRLNHPELHVVVEARQDLIPHLIRMRDLNGARFNVVQAALAYDSPTVEFFHDPTNLGSSVHRRLETSSIVSARSLESIASDARFDRFALICDIEGSEIDLIEREPNFLRNHVSWLLLELHPGISGQEQVDEAQAKLRQIGFVLIAVSANVFCLRNESLATQA